jgi:hypothetical protein
MVDFIVAIFLSLFGPHTWAAVSVHGTWSGSFDTGDLRGGLLLRLPAGSEPPSLILQPSGRTTIYRVENLHVSADAVILEAPAGRGRRLRFEGHVAGDRLTGSVQLSSGTKLVKRRVVCRSVGTGSEGRTPSAGSRT